MSLGHLVCRVPGPSHPCPPALQVTPMLVESCHSLPSCGCPTAHWCSSTPLWPGLSWTPGGSSCAAPVSTPTAPSAPSSTASRPRSSGCLPAAVQGRDGGAREAHGWPQLHQLRRGPQKTQTRGSEVTGPQAAGPPLQEQGLVSAPSEGCPPPAQPLLPPSVCSCAGSCPLVAGRARRGETLLCQRLFWVPGAFPPHERGLVTCPSSGPVAGLHLGSSLPSSGSGGGGEEQEEAGRVPAFTGVKLGPSICYYSFV